MGLFTRLVTYACVSHKSFIREIVSTCIFIATYRSIDSRKRSWVKAFANWRKSRRKLLTDCKTKMWAGPYYTCTYSAKQNCGKNFHGRQRIKVRESFHLFRLYIRCKYCCCLSSRYGVGNVILSDILKPSNKENLEGKEKECPHTPL